MHCKLAVIGNSTSILIYQALGVEAHSVAEPSQARNVLEDLSSRQQNVEQKTAEYAIIFVEETYYKGLPDDLLIKLSKKPLPAVVPVPSPESQDKDFGLKRISKIVERAVGSDIAG